MFVGVFLVVVGVISLALVVLLVGLVRHVKVLAQAVAQFQREIQPAVVRIREDADAARERMASTSERAERLRADAERLRSSGRKRRR